MEPFIFFSHGHATQPEAHGAVDIVGLFLGYLDGEEIASLWHATDAGRLGA